MKRFGGCIVSFLLVAVSASANSIQLLVNGGFETGDFTGWNAQTEANSSGQFSVSSSTTGPISQLPTAGPSSGTFYAVADQNFEMAAVLTQSFTVAAGASSVIVSFDLFTNNYNPDGIVGGTLDYKQGSQFATADLLTGTAGAFSTAPADVLRNFFHGGTPATLNGAPNPYITYSFDITSLVSGGGTYQIRFGDVAAQLFLTTGVDNVSVIETLPEPPTFLLIVPALGFLAVWKRRTQPDSPR